MHRAGELLDGVFRDYGPAPAQRTVRAVSGEVSQDPHTCVKCGAEFLRPVVVLGEGRVIGRIDPANALCPACTEAAREAEEAAAAELRRRDRAATRNAQYVERLKRGGLTDPKLWGATLDNFDASETPDALEAARAFVGKVLKRDGDDPMRWLFFAGPTGNGKSHLLVAIDRALYVADFRGSVIIDCAPALVRRIQRSYGRGGEADAQIQRRVNADVWICDDLGRGKQSGDAVRIANEILCERAGRPTALTSNYDRTGLSERHDDYETLVSRLGDAYCRTVLMTGRDRREDQPNLPL
jgi:DNA replication protein DnaC